MSKTSAPRPWTARALIALVRAAYYHSWLVIGLGILLCGASIWLAANYLEFQTDRAALVDDNEHFKILADNFNKEFPLNDDIVVLVDGGRTAEREAFMDALGQRLKEQPEIFKNVFWRVELPFLKTHALLYLDAEDLKKLVAALREAQSMMTALSSEQGVGELLSQSTKDMAKMLPILNEILGQLLTSLQTRGRYTYSSPWEKTFFEGASEKASENEALQDATGRDYFFNTLANGQKHVLLVRYVSDVADTVKHLRAEVRRLKPAFPDVEVGITGESILDLDEMESSIADSTKATLWSLVLVSLMFAFAFQKLTRPLMALFALLLGLGWTIGFTTLAIGHLNLLTVTFATILVGLGADFGIHSIYRYEEERARGQVPLQAMETCIEETGLENFTGAITTAVAFWAIRFTDFRGVAELGMIAGTGVMLCFFAMATVLPALIFLQEKGVGLPVEPRPTWAAPLAAAEEWLLSRPWWVIAFCVWASLWCVVQLPKVVFDYNLLNLQSHSLPSVQTELKLIASDNHGVLFAVSLADDVPTAQRKQEAFAKLKSVSKVESVLPLIPDDYEHKKPIIDELEQLMKDVPLPDPDGPSQSGTRSGLMQMGEGFMQLETAFREAYPHLLASPDVEVRRQAGRFKQLLNRLFSTLEKMGPGPISDSVTTFQTNLFGDLRGVLEFLKAQRSEPAVTLDSLPEQIRIRSLGTSGKILLRVYPANNPWEREPLTAFISDIQSVDPDIIGTPVMIFYHTEALKRAYEVSGWYALGAIVFLLLLHFRAVGTTMLALLPKLVGVLWMLGLMAFYGVNFNPANFMALPLILGIGLIFGVHVVHRLLHDPQSGIFSHSTGPAIALSAMTTMTGFGTLMMARHQGIASLGFLMTVGVGANLVTSLLLLPAVMRVLYKPKPLQFEDSDES